MVIDSYAIHAAAQRSYQRVEATGFHMAIGPTPGPMVQSGAVVNAIGAQPPAENPQDSSQGAYSSGYSAGLRAGQAQGLSFGGRLPMNREELKLQLLDSLLYRLTGRRITMQPVDAGTSQAPVRLPAQNTARVTARQFTYEYESVDYNAKGIVKTADGKTISLDLSMHMSREFAQYTQISLEAASRPIDPLVINYGGTAASLTGEKFSFDLDSDGKADSISFAGQGSGFLALDKNGDGTINDGSELFGPQTGSGFDELRAYDSDGNHWIDEADAVFARLRVWSKDADGNDQLFTLKQLGIGAIYLGDVATEFSLTSSTGAAQGVMRSTSFFLKENGSAGTISHIDLHV